MSDSPVVGAAEGAVSPFPAQIRGARGMLDWSLTDLAEAAGVSVSTVRRIERDGGQPVSDEAREIVRVALERVGVVLTDRDGWIGVALGPRPTEAR